MYLFERQRSTELFHPLLPQVPAKAKAESDQSQEPGTPSVSSACHAPRCGLAENSNQKWNRTWDPAIQYALQAPECVCHVENSCPSNTCVVKKREECNLHRVLI